MQKKQNGKLKQILNVKFSGMKQFNLYSAQIHFKIPIRNISRDCGSETKKKKIIRGKKKRFER